MSECILTHANVNVGVFLGWLYRERMLTVASKGFDVLCLGIMRLCALLYLSSALFR